MSELPTVLIFVLSMQLEPFWKKWGGFGGVGFLKMRNEKKKMHLEATNKLDCCSVKISYILLETDYRKSMLVYRGALTIEYVPLEQWLCIYSVVRTHFADMHTT